MSDATEKTVLDIAAETATGDLRDMIIGHFRMMEDPWSKLSERQQEDKIETATKAAEHAIRTIVNLIAQRGFTHVHGQLGKFTVDKGIKLEVTAPSTAGNIERLAEHGKGNVLLVFAEPAQYFGARAEARADPDEPGLPLEAEDDEEDEDDSLFDARSDEPEPVATTDFPDIPEDLDRRGKALA